MKKILLFVVAISLLVLTGCSNNSSSAYKTESLENLETLLADGYKLVDVREVSEYNEGHIEGAINVPLSDIESGNYGTLSKDEKYVIICRSGNRSATASDILSSNGFTVVNLSKGMSSWTGDVVQ